MSVFISIGVLYILKPTLTWAFKTSEDTLGDPLMQPNPAAPTLHFPALVEDGSNGEVTSDGISTNALKIAGYVKDSIASTSALKFKESLQASKNSIIPDSVENASNTEDAKDRILKVDGQLHLAYTQIGTFF